MPGLPNGSAVHPSIGSVWIQASDFGSMIVWIRKVQDLKMDPRPKLCGSKVPSGFFRCATVDPKLLVWIFGSKPNLGRKSLDAPNTPSTI
ncbi:hypothetical protein L596_004574 [Steinernema carpocapsae]|uniref:Uncharacterized protein n=1 Tax=Steinernema carpocapsae TaxID=34508 RepID=A0A4U8UXA4_STECR|nr:hypothetical protein L596_004574 [Steinernema carpocapsae]